MIVVGYTPDRFGEAALTHAIAEAHRRNTALRVVNAAKGDPLGDPTFAARGELLNVQNQLDESGVDYEMVQSIGADVVETLLGVMAEPAAELLVIGMRNRTPVGKLLLGSTAQRLLLACPKPVLAVKPD